MSERHFFAKTVTVYNRMETEKGEHWKAATLTGVCWQGQSAQKAGSAALPSAAETGKSKLYIPFCAESGSKAYCPPELFDTLGEETAAWTLRPGDVVCQGKGPSVIEGSPLRTLVRKSGHLITAVAEHDAPGQMGHWEVTVR